ncbi:p-loop containing nucleoside triphosphate hydrolase [Venustampulla echinocandica]|uniref:p-loop containing nucleoside triphosphate hydrolase n=1 Tax=Venustampulla echinocandica TaxID=2656787 RepID=A0A370U0K7_9HELO|nr:p-loop containing nucleoside triphosphate hydrolase [Venustampulla echinocandica]RDL41304.1 p-loop containing nucleoside triphosphate hydrolase [Venustampulla echinocandica]
MAHSAPEKASAPPDPAAGVVENAAPSGDHAVAIDNDEKGYVETTADQDPSRLGKSDAGVADNEEKASEHAIQPTKSYATNTSGVTRTDSHVDRPVEPKPWYKQLNPLRWGGIPPVPQQRTMSREYTAGFFSLVYFQWVAPLMVVGYKRPLELKDIWTVNPNRTAERMTLKLQASFKKRVARGDKYPLLWSLHETFQLEFWIGGICQFFANIFMVVSPFTLRYLIQFATEAYIAQRNGDPAPPIGRGIGIVLGITFMQMCQSLGTNHFIYRGMMIGGQSRAVLISVIFEKAMSISGRAKAGGREIDEGDEPEKANRGGVEQKKKSKKTKKGEPPVGADAGRGIAGDGTGWANGRVVNLMSVDTYRVDLASGLFHMIWTAPIACIVTLVLLVINLTYSALAGFALLVIGLPLLTEAVKSLFVRRRAINKVTDQRVSLTQEILQAVRFVKFFGWESAFLKRLGDIRDQEISAIQVLLAIRNAINAVSMSLPIFASMLAFVTYSLTNHDLNPAHVFSSLALFNSLRMPLNLLPLVIGQVTDAWSSVQRIQEYLLCEEQDDEAKIDMDAKNAVDVEHADFTWERTATQDPDAAPMVGKKPTKEEVKAEKAEKRAMKDKNSQDAVPSGDSTPDDASTLTDAREPFKLQNLNFSIGRNELVAVIGGVGSGKSSLLAALAGDMRKSKGDMVLGASRAFCPQYAWIQNATVRENIIFGKEMDKDWYKQVIDACALQPDLDMLPQGDATEIGERGITVSGGQKQRLNIARAIYFDADFILMDDPLSAVDAHVGRHIFDSAILGLLKNKSRVLATHQLWVLSRCDRIIWMEEGRIYAVDTFDNLMKNHPGFQLLMETTAVEEKQEAQEDDSEDEIEEEKKTVKKKRGGVPLMQAEERAVKSVPWSVYVDYIRASGSVFNAAIVVMFLLLAQGANIATSLWLSWWTSNKFGYSKGVYIGVYGALGGIQAVLLFAFSISLTMFGTIASKTMLNRAITRALRAPMSFFDTTPLGRITNRFSRDVDVMDNNLTDAIRMYFLTLAMILSVFGLIIAYFHYFTIALVPLFFLFVFSAGYYRASAREMKRFEAVLRSHVFAKFSEGLSGTACIRAYGLKDRFVKNIRDSIDDMNSAYFLTFANQRWLSTRLDIIGNLLVFVTGILVVTSRFSVSPSIAGLVLSYILSIVQMIQFTVRQLAEVENGMNATERIHYYGTQLEEEAPLHTVEVRKSWPERGEIIFDNVQMRYREGLPLVLSGLDMHVTGGERIGVVGRTGAGKSSIMSTLFRLVELSGGSITIDGLDISTIGLQDLRSRLAIIPQDPTLFKGTIRSNLDPFSEHTDLELWSALRQSDLVSEDASLDDKSPGRIHLDGIVEDDGLNFSLGQRQLMALARALVRGSQIIICDEATSSVDMETDEKIQRTIATGFKGKTLLCIAHRLKTIINYDRICVMEQGRIAELDTPFALYERGGIFRSMCDRGGIRKEDFTDYNQDI